MNSERSQRQLDERVLMLVLTEKDGATTQALLRSAGIEAHACADFRELLRELAAGCAVLVVAEERMVSAESKRLAAVLRGQPPWSDLPLLLITREGADSPRAREAVSTLGNVTLLERPLRITTLLSAVRTALRARRRQYQIRGHLEERERAAEALRAADQRKDEFLATLGHELRNPLAPLLTGLHLLRLSGGQDPTIARMTDVMERQITHLVRLVDDLLEVSRITRGVIDVQREPVELGVLIRSAVETTRQMFESARHRLTVELPDAPIMISGDAVRLAQVFANLLANAAKYTDAGGRVSLTARCRGGQAVVAVRDNGIGISPTHLKSVFEMFMQVDRSNRRAQGGLGIGLTLVRSLVEMHGGSVEAHSAGLGKGSEFIVTLPVIDAGAAEDARPGTPLPEFAERRILVVDDNRDAADTLAMLLETLGADVEVAYGGQMALDSLARFAPDTVLLDIGMPEIDGYEVARRIRLEPRNERVMLVALTGWGQDQDFRLSKTAGFDHHLVKPPDIDELRAALARSSRTPQSLTGAQAHARNASRAARS
ncbi:MAG TPA: ATP-binding protein [Gammaproteobacteria bacterium]|nr:ATP-binding protein [Gammaproteobacteria bacterium]